MAGGQIIAHYDRIFILSTVGICIGAPQVGRR
jgi:hypothetical protein